MSEGGGLKSASLESEARHRVVGRFIAATVAAVFVASTVWCLAPRDTLPHLPGFALLLMFIGWLTVAAARPVLWWVATRSLSGGVGYQLDDQGLSLRHRDGRQLHLARNVLAVAWSPRPRSVQVIARDGTQADLDFDDEGSVATFLDSFRAADAHARAYAVRVESPSRRARRKLIGMVFPFALAPLFAPFHPLLAAVGFGAAGMLGWLMAFGAADVELGADGVHVRGRFRQRYVRYRDIARIDVGHGYVAGTGQIALHRQDGKHVSVPGWFVPMARVSLLAGLIEEGRRMSVAGALAGAEIAQLRRRDDETDADWIARASRASQGEGFRVAGLGVERLETLMRNPAADPEQRVAAALALRVEPLGLDSIREAAEASTDPEVKEIFSALASAELDDEELDETVGDLSRPPLKRSAT